MLLFFLHRVLSFWWRLCLAFSLGACALFPSAQAANNIFTNTAGGSWEDPNNWTGGSPDFTDFIWITNSGSYSVVLDNTTADTDPGGPTSWLVVSNLNLGNSGGSPTLLLNFTNDARSLIIGQTSGGVVNIGHTGNTRSDLIVSNGTLVVSNNFNIAEGGASLGNLEIHGGKVFATLNGAALRVGNQSTATGMVLLTGGELIATNGANAASYIGNAGRGTLIQSNGIARFTLLRFGNSSSGDGEWNLYGGTNQILTTLSTGQAAGLTGIVVATGGRLEIGGTATFGVSGYGLLTVSNTDFSAGGISVGTSSGGIGEVDIHAGTGTNGLGTVSMAGGASSQARFTVHSGTNLANQLNVGEGGLGNGRFELLDGSLIVTNTGAPLRIGNSTGTGMVVVAGGELTVTNGANISHIGNSGRLGALIISNGMVRLNDVRLGSSSSATGQLNLFGGTNQLLGTLMLGVGASNTGEVLVAGGHLDVDGFTTVGVSGRGNLVVSNGTLVAAGINVGQNAGSSGEARFLGGVATITTAVGGNLTLGRADLTSTGTALVSGPAIVEFNRSVTVNNGGFTNQNGGTVRFIQSANDPTFTLGTGMAFVITNAIFEFKDYSAARVFGGITNITFLGDNTLSLNNSTNQIIGEYTFDSGTAPNFAHLRMINGGTRWQSTNLNIGSGGTLLASNTTGTVRGIVTNSGAITVLNSRMTWESNLVIHGSYVSDPSTNTFLADVTLSETGTLAGGADDLFDFKKSLLIGNTNNTLGTFDLSQSSVSFSGGGRHTNAIAGVDFGNDGTNGFPDGFTSVNFSYGRLTLGSTNDNVFFTSGTGAASNALYITWLDLAGFTNQYSSVNAMITNLLFASPNVNVYYGSSIFESGNAYLFDQVYQLQDGAGGLGGFLMPAIPEPSTLMLLVVAGGLIARSRSRRK